MTYRIVVTPTALRLLKAVSDRRVREKIGQRIDGLAHDPEKQGKPLGGELAAFRSLRAVGQRYRILYRVDRTQVLVMIFAMGLRKEGDRNDIYQLTKRLLRLGFI